LSKQATVRTKTTTLSSLNQSPANLFLHNPDFSLYSKICTERERIQYFACSSTHKRKNKNHGSPTKTTHHRSKTHETFDKVVVIHHLPHHLVLYSLRYKDSFHCKIPSSKQHIEESSSRGASDEDDQCHAHSNIFEITKPDERKTIEI
jgi:hypothetical protein